MEQYHEKNLEIQKALIQKKEFPIPENINDKNIIEIIKLGTMIDSKNRKTMKELNEIVQKL